MSSIKTAWQGLLSITACAAALGGASGALAQEKPQGPTNMDTVRVAAGLTLPVYATNAFPTDFNRIFVVEQRSGTTGRIRIVNNLYGTPALAATPFISISPVATGNEEGLLGLAFHPDYANNGYFYVYFTNSSGNNVIRRYRANGPNFAIATTADTATASDVMTISHPTQSNHNGGWMSFGPDGYLYIATGDGGSANDPPGNAQNVNELKGKMLRIDIDGADNLPGNDDDDGDVDVPPSTNGYTNPADNPFFGATAGRDEILCVGLRNHWRNAFDRETGDLYIADVGQNAWEEINVREFDVPTTPVTNYGWRCMEGTVCTGLTGCTCNGPALTLPVHTYGHTGGACSLTGGEVYRGCSMPDMQGLYFYADYCSNQIFSFRYDRATNTISELTNRTAELAPGGGLSIGSVTSFGLDAYNEVYIVDQGGELYRIIPTPPPPGPDCNANGRNDACDLLANPAADCNDNGTLDSCDIVSNPALDCNSNGSIDSCEIAANPALDCDANGALDSCQIASNPALDCDGNATLDSCELAANDCNENGTLDACDISANPALDCDTNGTLDSCELAENDCDKSGTLDACDIAADPTLDCDDNDTIDSCELAEHDCNQNSTLDACDIEAGASRDCFDFDAPQVPGGPYVAGGANGIPDECECVADWNRDGVSNSADVGEHINTFFADDATGGKTLGADIDCNGVSNSTDVGEFINIYFAAQAGQLPFSGCTL